jgi:hypothetical protein
MQIITVRFYASALAVARKKPAALRLPVWVVDKGCFFNFL